eukprot:Ihof_evm2s523 gene=Ihof_evmTU2s523
MSIQHRRRSSVSQFPLFISRTPGDNEKYSLPAKLKFPRQKQSTPVTTQLLAVGSSSSATHQEPKVSLSQSLPLSKPLGKDKKQPTQYNAKTPINDKQKTPTKACKTSSAFKRPHSVYAFTRLPSMSTPHCPSIPTSTATPSQERSTNNSPNNKTSSQLPEKVDHNLTTKEPIAEHDSVEAESSQSAETSVKVTNSNKVNREDVSLKAPGFEISTDFSVITDSKIKRLRLGNTKAISCSCCNSIDRSLYKSDLHAGKLVCKTCRQGELSSMIPSIPGLSRPLSSLRKRLSPCNTMPNTVSGSITALSHQEINSPALDVRNHSNNQEHIMSDMSAANRIEKESSHTRSLTLNSNKTKRHQTTTPKPLSIRAAKEKYKSPLPTEHISTKYTKDNNTPRKFYTKGCYKNTPKSIERPQNSKSIIAKRPGRPSGSKNRATTITTTREKGIANEQKELCLRSRMREWTNHTGDGKDTAMVTGADPGNAQFTTNIFDYISTPDWAKQDKKRETGRIDSNPFIYASKARPRSTYSRQSRTISPIVRSSSVETQITSLCKANKARASTPIKKPVNAWPSNQGQVSSCPSMPSPIKMPLYTRTPGSRSSGSKDRIGYYPSLTGSPNRVTQKLNAVFWRAGAQQHDSTCRLDNNHLHTTSYERTPSTNQNPSDKDITLMGQLNQNTSSRHKATEVDYTGPKSTPITKSSIIK